MYEAKNAGKNQYRFFDLEENQLLREYQEFLVEFTHAIISNELELHYQPKVDMKAGKVLGVEALVRWNQSEKGLLYPDDFLPQVNDNEEIMLKLGRWVVKSAIEQLSSWLSKGYDLSMNINISAHEFNNKDTLPFISSLLEKHKMIDPSQIELEILETHALKDINMAHNIIQECHLLGLSIALDDFGTGYSTMSYLKEHPVNTLKIDKSFVMEMLNDSGSFSILEAAMGLSHAFRCKTIAEGVESEVHGKVLIELGCNIGQGFVIAKPMNADAFEIWLKEWKPFESWKVTKTPNLQKHTMHTAIIEHRQWMNMLEAYINKKNTLLPELNYDQCRFGQWLQHEAKEEIKDSVKLEKVIQLHSSMHSLAKNMITNNKHSLLNELNLIDSELLQLLTEDA